MRRYPLQDLTFERASIVELWSSETGAEVKLVDSLGTIPEAMSDFADRMKIYGDTLPSQALWKTELALRDSGYSRIDIRRELEQLDDRMDRMTAVAENAPELVHDAVVKVPVSIIRVLQSVPPSCQQLQNHSTDQLVYSNNPHIHKDPAPPVSQ